MALELKQSYETDISGFEGYITFWQCNSPIGREQVITLTKLQFLGLIKNAQTLLDEADAEYDE